MLGQRYEKSTKMTQFSSTDLPLLQEGKKEREGGKGAVSQIRQEMS